MQKKLIITDNRLPPKLSESQMVHQTTPETLESGLVTAVLDEYWEFLLARLKEFLDPEEYKVLTPVFYQHFKLEHREYISNPTLKC